MESNKTQSETCSNWDFGRNIKVLFGVLCVTLLLSLSWNIICCVLKGWSGKKTRARQSRSPRRMEENPIYGNLSYMQTNVVVSTEDDPQQLSLSSASLRDQQRVTSTSQAKTQDCYANLTLKAAKLNSGRSSPQVQYSDVVQIEEPSVSEKEEGSTDAVSVMSDLYASVQTQRTKTVNTADDGEDYANHL